MSTVIPTQDQAFVNWINTHAPLWNTNKALIGLTSAQATLFVGEAADVDKAWSDLADAKLALRKAYDAWKDAKQHGVALARTDVTIIKAFAAQSATPADVYTAADIPAPKTPNYNQPPAPVTNVKATLNTVNGELKLTWKCDNPASLSGTVYTIERRVGTTGAWTPLGLSSIKSFTDLTLPAAATVQYQITATRSGMVGVSSGPVSVVFGHAANGDTFVADVTQGEAPVRIAA